MTHLPTQSSPAGCLFGVLGMFFAALGAVGGWAFYLWLRLPDEERHFDGTFWLSIGAATMGGVAAIVLWWLAIKLLRNTDFRKYDSRDPDKKGLKW